jgi:hypothetical protein
MLPSVKLVIIVGVTVGRAEANLGLVVVVGSPEVELGEGLRRERGVPRTRQAAEANHGLGR